MKKWIGLLLAALLLITPLSGAAAEEAPWDIAFEPVGHYVYYAHLSTDCSTDVLNTLCPPDLQREVCQTQAGSIWQIEMLCQGEEEYGLMLDAVAAAAQQDGVLAVREERVGDHTGELDGKEGITASDALICLQLAVGKRLPATLDEWYHARMKDGVDTNIPLMPDAACALRILKLAVGK